MQPIVCTEVIVFVNCFDRAGWELYSTHSLALGWALYST